MKRQIRRRQGGKKTQQSEAAGANNCLLWPLPLLLPKGQIMAENKLVPIYIAYVMQVIRAFVSSGILDQSTQTHTLSWR